MIFRSSESQLCFPILSHSQKEPYDERGVYSFLDDSRLKSKLLILFYLRPFYRLEAKILMFLVVFGSSRKRLH
jgi:hypothetical protein